ncbi:MAG: hypothetical protein KF753_05305 [Caldilineaceae bacterium]|nr:hypothetical protein [Caldilineaceae bacterium]
MDQVKTIQSYPLVLENFGLAAMSDLFDDWVVYRNLEPVERRLKGLKSARVQLELNITGIPRKLDDAYAQVAMWIFEKAQALRRAQVSELLFIGDTLSGDGKAYQNLYGLSQLPGSCFIGSEKADQEPWYSKDEQTGIFSANRWAHLADWLALEKSQGLKLDKNTVVVMDMDKTAIGARGRNDRAIDSARLKGLYRTVGNVLGDDFDAKLFESHYDTLNHNKYHHVTQDNQDYLAYMCLVLNNGTIDCIDLMASIDNGGIETFRQFVRYVETCIVGGGRVSEAMRQAHTAVHTSVQAGDPTPFKSFRRQEFLATLEHMNNLPDEIPMAERLLREITITQEVRETGLWLRERGCLVICLSDKPDEASAPNHPSLREKLPIHRAQTHAVGVSIAQALAALD